MAFLAGKRPSATSVIAVGALVCAVSGTAVATASTRNGNTLIAKHTLSANRLIDHTVTGRQVKALVWHTLTLENGWLVYDASYSGAPQYAKDALGIVHLRGAIKGDASTSDLFAHLPDGFRPADLNVWLPVASTNNSSNPQTFAIDVLSTDGSVTAFAGAGANKKFVSLAGVAFPAA